MLPHFIKQHFSFLPLISSAKSSNHSQSNDTFTHSRIYEKNIWTHDYGESLQCDVKVFLAWIMIDTSISSRKKINETLTDESVKICVKLVPIDDLQRLGVGYHFEKEIKRSLDILFGYEEALTEYDLKKFIIEVIRNTSSSGYCIWITFFTHYYFLLILDMFKWFMNEDGSFRVGLCEDVKGMLGLYEASHLCLEAKEFKVKHLKLRGGNIDPDLAKEVNRALDLPLHWRMPRLEARHYIEVYQRKEDIDPSLLELAKVDFNALQATHQKELRNMSRWWKDLGLSDKLGTRDRLVESFLWSVGLTSQPQDRCCREWLTKVICLRLTIDDIYDIIGSLSEMFTTAVERWDLEAMELLPEYMKICFSALFNTTSDIWADFCKAMLVEAKWSKMGYIPSPTEYLQNAWISSSVTVGLIHAFFATNQTIRNSVLESLDNNPDLIYYSAMVFRLCNDLATSPAELDRGDVSAIPCYMNEAKTSELIAREKIKSLISDIWKKLNESIYDSAFEHSFVTISINNARTDHNIYQHGDGIGVQDHEARKRVARLLFEPISVNKSKSP
ncbi:hypothetical protein ACHQM5_003795 [Ranunculus cassubicifolius]